MASVSRKKSSARRKAKKFRVKHLIDIYELAKAGHSNNQIRHTLGISQKTWEAWQRRRSVCYVLSRAKAARKNGAGGDLKKYILGRLPDELKRTWRLMMDVDRSDDGNAVHRLETLLQGHGKRGRQMLFLESLISTGFNVSSACKMVNVTRRTFESWLDNDHEFGDMVREVLEAKKDFFEAALIGRVAAGDTAAIVFANKSINKDRGYGQEVNVNHNVSGEVRQLHGHISLDQLDLPLDVQREVMKAIRLKEEEQRKLEVQKHEVVEV